MGRCWLDAGYPYLFECKRRLRSGGWLQYKFCFEVSSALLIPKIMEEYIPNEKVRSMKRSLFVILGTLCFAIAGKAQITGQF